MSYEIRRRKKQILNRLLGVVCLCFVLGVVIGCFCAIYTHSTDGVSLINSYFKSDLASAYDGGNVLANWLKDAKYIIAIIICGYTAFGIIPTVGLLIFKGISYGFTSGILFCQYGLKGVYYIFSLLLVQGFFIVPAFLLISYSSVEFILSRKNNMPNKKSAKGEFNKSRAEYTIIGIGCICACFVGAMIEMVMCRLVI